MADFVEVDHLEVLITGVGFFEFFVFQIYLNAIAVSNGPILRCVKGFEEDGSEGDARHKNWDAWVKNQTNWYVIPGFDFTQLELDGYMRCSNSTGEEQCPKEYTCLKEHDVDFAFTPPLDLWWGEFNMLLSKFSQFTVF